MKKIHKKLLLTCLMAAMIVIAACSKKDKDTVETITAPTETETPAPTTEAPLETQPETEPVYISESDALEKVQEEIGERGYFFEILEKDKRIGTKTYYLIQVSDSSSPIEPHILADKESGELLCYYEDGTTAPFAEFPLYTAPTSETSESGTDSDEITKEEALSMLSKLPAKTLGLEKSLSEYTIVEFDTWTTFVNNTECYGINVYEKVGGQEQTVGIFYVALDGTKMFRYDSVDEMFIEVSGTVNKQ